MSQLHDLFRQCPLSKNGLYSIEYHVNTCKMACVIAGAAGSKVYTSVEVSESSGYNPIQLGTLDDANIGQILPTACLAIDVELKINQELSCRMEVELLTMESGKETDYIKNPIRSFTYEEHFFIKHTIEPATNLTGADKAFSFLLHNNLVRGRKLVILPYYENGGDLITSLSDVLSPFSSFASSTLSSPCCGLTDFNCYVSGVQVYPQNLKTKKQLYDEFNRFSTNNGIDNADKNSSPVTWLDYCTQYGAICVDLSQHLKSQDDLARSILISGNSANSQRVSLLCYLYYDKCLTVDCDAGNVVREAGTF